MGDAIDNSAENPQVATTRRVRLQVSASRVAVYSDEELAAEFDRTISSTDAEELRYLLWRLEDARRHALGTPTSARSQILQQLGETAAARFIGKGAREVLNSIVSEESTAGSVHLAIDIDSDLALANVPWEAMPLAPGTPPIAMDARVTVVRSVGNHGDDVAIERVSVLAALSRPVEPEEIVELNAAAEMRMLRTIWLDSHEATIAVVEAEASWIRIALESNPALLHLSGHGRAGAFRVSNSTGRGADMTGAELAELIRAASSQPRVVVISSCLSATADERAVSIAESLIEAGVDIVVAMRDSVTERYAIDFCQHFYSTLRAGSFVSEAASEARRLVKSAHDEWATPIILERRRVYVPKRPTATTSLAVPPEVFDVPYVSRTAVDNSLANWLLGDSGVVILYGPPGIGKSESAFHAVTNRPGVRLGVLRGPATVDALFEAFFSAARMGGADSNAERRLAPLAVSTEAPRERLAKLSDIAAEEDWNLVVLWEDADTSLRVTAARGEPRSLWHELADDSLVTFIEALLEIGSPHLKLLITSRWLFSARGKDLPLAPAMGVGAMSETQFRRLFPEHEITDLLWSWTGGHPGAATWFVAALEENESLRKDIRLAMLYALDLVRQEMDVDGLLAAFDPITRSAATLAAVFRRPVSFRGLIDQRFATFPETGPDAERLYKLLASTEGQDPGLTIDWDRAPLNPELRRQLAADRERWPWINLTPYGALRVFESLMAAGFLSPVNAFTEHGLDYVVSMQPWLAAEFMAREPELARAAHRQAVEYWLEAIDLGKLPQIMWEEV